MDFSRTIGHEKQKELFLRAIAGNRLAHSFVFSGPENIGKTTFALDLGNLVGAHPVFDVTLLDAENGLSVEDARNLQGRLSLAATGKMKLAVIAGAERVSASVANLFLKTLEEPPSQSLIVLTTANFQALLPTIASRVQRVSFSRLSDVEVRRALSDSALEERRLDAVVAFCSGRLGLAKRIASSPELYDFFDEASRRVEALSSGSLQVRMRTAELVAQYEDGDLRNFLHLAMRRWVASGGNPKLGDKLLKTWTDTRFNLNQKLLVDNLFLT